MAIISQDYHYIRYRDGSEELYDRQADPNQWNNLAEANENELTLKRHRDGCPKSILPSWDQVPPDIGPSSLRRKTITRQRVAENVNCRNSGEFRYGRDAVAEAAQAFGGADIQRNPPKLRRSSRYGI